jgi:hypothetical protein
VRFGNQPEVVAGNRFSGETSFGCSRALTRSFNPFTGTINHQGRQAAAVALRSPARASAARMGDPTSAVPREPAHVLKKSSPHPDPDTPGHETPATPACPVYMRKQRNRIGGAMWNLIRRGKWGRVSTFTLIGRGWAFSAGSLSEADAIKLLASVRSDLNRSGAKLADGWLILGIHGEYDPARACTSCMCTAWRPTA